MGVDSDTEQNDIINIEDPDIDVTEETPVQEDIPESPVDIVKRDAIERIQRKDKFISDVKKIVKDVIKNNQYFEEFAEKNFVGDPEVRLCKYFNVEQALAVIFTLANGSNYRHKLLQGRITCSGDRLQIGVRFEKTSIKTLTDPEPEAMFADDIMVQKLNNCITYEVCDYIHADGGLSSINDMTGDQGGLEGELRGFYQLSYSLDRALELKNEEITYSLISHSSTASQQDFNLHLQADRMTIKLCNTLGILDIATEDNPGFRIAAFCKEGAIIIPNMKLSDSGKSRFKFKQPINNSAVKARFKKIIIGITGKAAKDISFLNEYIVYVPYTYFS